MKPFRSLVGATGHQEREPGSSSGVPHPGELPLARVRVAGVGQPLFAVAVPLDSPLEIRGPIRHGSEA